MSTKGFINLGINDFFFLINENISAFQHQNKVIVNPIRNLQII